MKYIFILLVITSLPIQSFSKSCKSEIKSQIKHVEKTILVSKKESSQELEEAFTTNKYASTVEIAKKSQLKFEETLLPQLNQSLANIEQGVTESLRKLKSQGKNSKVCNDRSLISKLGSENINSFQGMLMLKTKLGIALAQNDGKIDEEFKKKYDTIQLLVRTLY